MTICKNKLSAVNQLLKLTVKAVCLKQIGIPEEEGGDLYLINGNMTKLKDAGIFAASAQTQEEADETKETQTEPEPEDGRTRFRKKEAL